MIDIRQAIKKASRLDLSDWRRLSLLVLGAVILGISCVFFDVASVSLLLKNKFQFAIGVNFLIVGFLSFFVGMLMVKLDRRHGYGGVPLFALIEIILFSEIILLQNHPDNFLLVNLLFIEKYLFPILVSVIFWSISTRFIVLKLNSLKYLGILAGQLTGFYIGGLLAPKYYFDGVDILWKVLLLWTGLLLIMKILVWILPQPSETFIRKSGGVQDSFEQKMVDCILVTAFVYMVGWAFSDYMLYQTLSETPSNVIFDLSKLWSSCGGIGILLLILLSQTRFLYTTFWGLLSLCFGLTLVAVGSYLSSAEQVYAGIVIFWVCRLLYWAPYMSLLPYPLTLGQGMRLRKKRQVIVEPLGFIFVGSVISTVSKGYFPLFLFGFSVLLMGLIFVSVFLYSRLLKRLLKIRMWCDGPLMLLSGKLKQYVLKGTQSSSFQDVVYFLKILDISHSAQYVSQLVKSLHHSSSDVRLFALDKLDSFSKNKNVLRSVYQVFQKDKDYTVRARALAVLIHSGKNENIRKDYSKYEGYLDDKKLKAGAILGFLQVGGEWALLAMDGLQKMVLSHQKSDNLMALKIIERIPQQGLVRLVLPLLQAADNEVVSDALLVAGRIAHAQTLGYIFQSLDKIELQENALKALKLYEKKAFPPLEKMIQNPNVPSERRKKLISFLGTVSSGEGKQILLRNLYLQDQKMRKEVFEAIWASKITWTSFQRKKILSQGIEQDVKWFHSLKDCVAMCVQPPLPALGDSFSFLKRAFQEMLQDIRTLILYQILLYTPSSLVRKAIDILKKNNPQNFISACGVLQDLLPTHIYQTVKPILLMGLDEEIKPKPMDIQEARTFLEQLLVSPFMPMNHWVMASALYGLQKIGDDNSKIVFKPVLMHPHPITLEAAFELLSHLEPDKKRRTLFLNKQISQMPRNFILENYLKQRKNI